MMKVNALPAPRQIHEAALAERGNGVPPSIDPPQFPLAVGGVPLVHVSARGLWDQFAAPCTREAMRRAYQRCVPSYVALDEEPAVDSFRTARLEARDVAWLLNECRAYDRHRLSAPFFFGLSSREALAAFLAAFHKRLRRDFSDCHLILNNCDGASDCSPDISAICELPARGDVEAVVASAQAPWGWHLPLRTVLGLVRTPDAPLPVALSDFPGRILFDSPNLVTDVALTRALPQSADSDIAARLARSCPRALLWRRTDLFESDFLRLSCEMGG